jgi:NAD-dependent deacetylase
MLPIKPHASLVILTGAGISKESGLETFRDADGLWAQHRIEDVCTPEAFIRNPDLVHEFYNQRRRQLLDPAVQPNLAHKALAQLQRDWKGKITLITQNIDDLHERGGSASVWHMHGELIRIHCLHCAAGHSTESETGVQSLCPHCNKAGGLRPDIVWFGEMPYHMPEIGNALADADMFIAIGTSGTVYPAAGFCDLARHHGARTVEINLEPSARAGVFDDGFYGAATVQVPQFVQSLSRLIL